MSRDARKWDWADLWAFLLAADKLASEDVAQQLDLKRFLAGLHADYQIEVLANAPSATVRYLADKKVTIKSRDGSRKTLSVLQPDAVEVLMELHKKMARRTRTPSTLTAHQPKRRRKASLA